MYILGYKPTNDRSFEVNKDVVRIAIEEVKSYFTSISSLIAITQVDVIGHSMGGLLARKWAGNIIGYKRKDNYRQGDIHKLITIDSPHSGSFLAEAAIKALNGPRTRECDNLFREMERRNMSVTAGAVYDMRTTSSVIENMNMVNIVPFCHSIIGFYEDVDVYFSPDSSFIWIIGPPEYYTIHTVLQQNGCNLLWDVTSSDMVITCESQQGGLGPFASEKFSHHHLNWQTELVGRHVIELLNEQTDIYFEQGFPVR